MWRSRLDTSEARMDGQPPAAPPRNRPPDETGAPLCGFDDCARIFPCMSFPSRRESPKTAAAPCGEAQSCVTGLSSCLPSAWIAPSSVHPRRAARQPPHDCSPGSLTRRQIHWHCIDVQIDIRPLLNRVASGYRRLTSPGQEAVFLKRTKVFTKSGPVDTR